VLARPISDGPVGETDQSQSINNADAFHRQGVQFMRIFKCSCIAIAAVLALVMCRAASASSILDPSGIHATTPIVGTSIVDPTFSFTATVESAYYTPADAGYAAYASVLGAIPAGDAILAYILHNNGINPSGDTLLDYTVFSGNKIDAVAFINGSGDSPVTSATFSNGAVDKASYDFSLAFPGQTGIMLFASSGLPVYQQASVSDGATGTGLVLSVTGPQGGGTPLPTPNAACGGLALVTIAAAFRYAKSRAQAM